MLKAYKRWRAKRRFVRSAALMTELGKEILHAMQHDEWKLDRYTITHPKSGLSLWIANGYHNFRIYRIDNLKFGDEEFKAMLSPEDRDVLWQYAMKIVRQHDVAPATAVLNVLRLSQHKTGETA